MALEIEQLSSTVSTLRVKAGEKSLNYIKDLESFVYSVEKKYLCSIIRGYKLSWSQLSFVSQKYSISKNTDIKTQTYLQHDKS